MNKSILIANDMKEKINLGIWAPGTKLPTECELCNIYNASRLTIGNSISILVAQGLIQTRRGSGNYILNTKLNDKNAITEFEQSELFEFRRILETECASLAAQRASNDQIRNMKQINNQMQSSSRKEEIILCDMKFHSLICTSTNNRLIIYAYNLLKPSFYTMFRKNVSALGSYGAETHSKIIAAIESRNSKQAKQYMYDHLNSTAELLFIS